MTIKGLCRFLGWVLALVGIAGFFAPRLLSLHLTPIHNVVHLASGALALYFGYAGSMAAARRFAFAFGLGYLGLGVLGFVAPSAIAALIGHPPVRTNELGPDNAVHLVLGGGFMLASAARVRTAARAREARSVVRRG